MTVSFFGHRNIFKANYRDKLFDLLKELIENQNADTFYVGHQGDFDFTVYSLLKDLKKVYPFIKFYVVLAYIPKRKYEYQYFDYDDSFFPEILDNVQEKFAIDRRNKWMVDISDYVITFVSHNYGGAAKFKEYAEKKKKTVINIAD